MLSGCAMIPVTNRTANTSAAEIPHAQKTTLRNPSWKMAKPTMPSKKSQCIYLTARHSPQLYAMGLFGSERFTDSAMDVTMIAAPMAFCRGVSDAHPVVRQSRQISRGFIDPPFFGNHSIAQAENAN